MRNLDHDKSNIIGIIFLLIGFSYTFAPYIFPDVTYNPPVTTKLILYGLGVGLLFMYPEPFESLVKKIVDKFTK